MTIHGPTPAELVGVGPNPRGSRMARKGVNPKMQALLEEREIQQQRAERLYTRLKRTWNAFDKTIQRLKRLERTLMQLEAESSVAR